MGCFNRTGFLSHLPITYGDEIVVFLLADTTKTDNIYSMPCYTNSAGYTPVCLPFFGIYDDYGSIENVTDDFNSRYFEKKTGMSIENACHMLLANDRNGMSINKIADKIKSLQDPHNIEYNKEERIKELKELDNLYRKIFDYTENSGSTDEFYARRMQRITNSSITFTMEHRFVYDKMVELGRQRFPDDDMYDYDDDNKYTLEEKFDHTKDTIKLFADRRKKYNPFTLGEIPFSIIDAGELAEYIDTQEYNKIGDALKQEEQLDRFNSAYWFSYDVGLACGHSGLFDYRLYNGCCDDISEMKQDAINYAHFLRMMHITSNVFMLSPSHSQTVDYSRVTILYKEMADFIQNKKEKYDSAK